MPTQTWSDICLKFSMGFQDGGRTPCIVGVPVLEAVDDGVSSSPVAEANSKLNTAIGARQGAGR